jgi:hypothetical protein
VALEGFLGLMLWGALGGWCVWLETYAHGPGTGAGSVPRGLQTSCGSRVTAAAAAGGWCGKL